MIHLLRATCPPCGERVPAKYTPSQYTIRERADPAWWDWAVWHPCTHTDAQLDQIESELEGQIPAHAEWPHPRPLADLIR